MSDNPLSQASLQLTTPDGGTTNVDKYEFGPIKGYPMLNWRGKRPFTSTQYYPAQLKEVHGEEVGGWRNKIFWGDNLQVMSHLLKEFRGKVDLIYIDPPFDSKADYKKRISLKGGSAEGDQSSFEEKQYGDIWNNDEYLQFLYERLVLLRELLTDSGSIYVHCDANRGHYIKCLMDEVFGVGNFRNEIIWKRTSARADSSTYNHVHDTIFFYTKTESFTWHKQFTEHSEAYLKSKYSSVDKEGRKYRLDNITSPNPRPNMTYEWKGFPPPANGWRYSQEKMAELDAQGRIWYPNVKTKRPQLIRYLDESDGRPLDSVWTDIFPVNSQASDRLDYPTQKPIDLMDRIIKASSDAGSLVFDCFMGSGTTLEAAMRLGRRFIGADINLGAIQTTAKRLISVSGNLSQMPIHEAKHFTGFELHNVNHYDIFRNPVQAKELLIEALEVQRLEFSTVFDGEKDGRMVKIMPVNRIATRADLNELVAGFDYKAWERKQNESPNRPVEKITLVCMGHESDLAARLELAAKPFKIDVEVVDILRDKANLEFKRESQAKVSIKNGELVVERFYPMNLLQKLSRQKENVEDWKEMVESVLIDWNYDGAVLQPAVVDIPGKNVLVKGAYKVPEEAGTIRVKITDLLSESWEGSVSHGD
ncbi:site-specific DNA-methyltransferase [Pseudomonas sp. B21-012]|jgi:site-specific DNA-methyltransferase (adenine-specific)/adenine-specific DNA-methyltransferase|uniref:site-specific DNA-methyltransferase n=1 Tax=Pseudomonas sp. B21-012 TaxID=2895472 RepID=UPI00216088D2|nr:site-specific DNA-methyltransferase [Pseudomonas sp. B21-012]UVM55360.1 site-specific DNA-methyltransferase [Pseudomonas sp. B21-012]